MALRRIVFFSSGGIKTDSLSTATSQSFTCAPPPPHSRSNLLTNRHEKCTNLQIRIHKRPLTGSPLEGNIKQPRLPADHHPAPSHKLKIRRGPARIYLSNQLSRRIPHVNSIARSGVHVSFAVSMHAVGDVRIDKRKGFAVLKGTVRLDGEPVNGRRVGELQPVPPDAGVGYVGIFPVRGECDAWISVSITYLELGGKGKE